MDHINQGKNPTRTRSQERQKAPVIQGKTMTTLLPYDCRWPIGDPQTAGFRFCGKQQQDGHPYCEVHVKKASTPSRPRAGQHLPSPRQLKGRS